MIRELIKGYWKELQFYKFWNSKTGIFTIISILCSIYCLIDSIFDICIKNCWWVKLSLGNTIVITGYGIIIAWKYMRKDLKYSQDIGKPYNDNYLSITTISWFFLLILVGVVLYIYFFEEYSKLWVSHLVDSAPIVTSCILFYIDRNLLINLNEYKKFVENECTLSSDEKDKIKIRLDSDFIELINVIKFVDLPCTVTLVIITILLYAIPIISDWYPMLGSTIAIKKEWLEVFCCGATGVTLITFNFIFIYLVSKDYISDEKRKLKK